MGKGEERIFGGREEKKERGARGASRGKKTRPDLARKKKRGSSGFSPPLEKKRDAPPPPYWEEKKGRLKIVDRWPEGERDSWACRDLGKKPENGSSHRKKEKEIAELPGKEEHRARGKGERKGSPSVCTKKVRSGLTPKGGKKS